MMSLDFREPVSAWTHLLWLLLALPATRLFWLRTRGSPAKRVGLLTFSFATLACFGGSWFYHSVPPSLEDIAVRIDHIGIFLLIAGTTTPIALVILRGWWRAATLGGIWSLAAAGITLRLLTELPVSALTGIYLFMGWIGCFNYFELVRLLSHADVRPVWVGGVFYSIGAVLNTFGWPVLVPGVVGAHEVFHLFVMAGSAAHYFFMLRVILPYRERAAEVTAAAPPPAETASEAAWLTGRAPG
jgi:hemolysin III